MLVLNRRDISTGEGYDTRHPANRPERMRKSNMERNN